MGQIAPNPLYPERAGQSYEGQVGPNIPGNKGPLRFEEGIASDTDVPSDFVTGAYADTGFYPGRLNHNVPTTRKWPEETTRERAHVGSAAWIEAPTMLSDFVQGSQAGYGLPTFERVVNADTYHYRRAPTVVTD